MSYSIEPQMARRWTAEITRLRGRAARLARRLPLDEPETVELLEACLSLSDSLLRDLSGATLASEGLRRQLLLLERWGMEVFDQMPAACVQVSEDGEILRANRAAASLLNTSAKHLQGRKLMPFVLDRDRFSTLLQDVAFDRTRTHAGQFTVRPRERAATEIRITVLQHPPGDEGTTLWFLAPVDASVTTETARRRRASSRIEPAVSANGHPRGGAGVIRRAASL